uniref:Uncharacterized protein n=1 Tax=Rhizophora mucronata TaxID=61149 RepID=A0A2P2QPG0_RHIMU
MLSNKLIGSCRIFCPFFYLLENCFVIINFAVVFCPGFMWTPTSNRLCDGPPHM